MHAPGVEVRPLRQITGEAEFNEVYMTDVRIPDAERLGGLGEGWHVALTTLMNERVSIGGGMGPAAGPSAKPFGCGSSTVTTTRLIRDQLMRLWVEAEVNRLTNIRCQPRCVRQPRPRGFHRQAAVAELQQRIAHFCVDLMAPTACSCRTTR